MFPNISNLSNGSGKEEEWKRYHSEEIMLILFICASDLSNYDQEDLVIFTEAIEGRIEVLFESSCLVGLRNYLQSTNASLEDFHELKDLLISLYAPSWHNKMMDNENCWSDIRIVANKILKELDIQLIEPLTFMETHLDCP